MTTLLLYIQVFIIDSIKFIKIVANVQTFFVFDMCRYTQSPDHNMRDTFVYLLNILFAMRLSLGSGYHNMIVD